MCGIFGVYSTHWTDAESKIFRELAILNVFRGEDGTGILRIDDRGKKGFNYKVVTSLDESPKFMYDPANEDFLKCDRQTLCMMGHTRWATVGEVKIENQHPFKKGDLIGFHNGTIKKKFRGTKDFETDSEALYELIEAIGLDDALNEAIDWDTAYALQFLDTKGDILGTKVPAIGFIKNNKRPLNFTYLYGKTTLVWSSDLETLKYVIRKNKMTGSGYGNTTEYWSLKETNLQYLCLGDVPRELKIVETDVKPTPVYTNARPYGWSGVMGNSRPYSPPATTGNTNHNTDLREEYWGDPFLDDSTPFYSGREDPNEFFEIKIFNGSSVWEKRSSIERKLKQGCMVCSSESTFDDFERGDTVWWDSDTYCCIDCFNDSEGNWVREMFENTEVHDIDYQEKEAS